jgi:hypothetical protein
VAATVEQAKQILRGDLEPDFIEAVALETAWQYSSLYDTLAADSTLVDDYREEEFRKHRGDCAIRALAHCANRYGVPYEFHRLECNGQRKLLVKASRVILIQECMLTLEDRPSANDYKRQLADIHGFVRQLELDLGDQPNRIRDWSGCILAVLLHAPAGRKFNREHKSLGSIMLGIPDAAYQQWILRLDLHSIAMYGRGSVPTENEFVDQNVIQPDNVFVTSKKRNSKSETA